MIVKHYTLLRERFILTLIGLLFVTAFTITGCGETENPLESEPVAISETTVTGTIAEMKGFAHRVPAAPPAPAAQNAGIPKVESVDFFSNWQLTTPITGSVSAGTTIYTKVVFSEPITFKPADDKTARPILYYTANGKSLRYRVKPHGTNGAKFVSGDAKPKGKRTTSFVGKYSVQASDTGTFHLLVGRLNTDRAGNTLEAFYRHPVKLRIGRTDDADDRRRYYDVYDDYSKRYYDDYGDDDDDSEHYYDDDRGRYYDNDSGRYYDYNRGNYYDDDRRRYYDNYDDDSGRYYDDDDDDDNSRRYYDDDRGRYYDDDSGRYYDYNRGNYYDDDDYPDGYRDDDDPDGYR